MNIEKFCQNKAAVWFSGAYHDLAAAGLLPPMVVAPPPAVLAAFDQLAKEWAPSDSVLEAEVDRWTVAMYPDAAVNYRSAFALVMYGNMQAYRCGKGVACDEPV